MADRQRYTPVMNQDLDESASTHHRASGPLPRRLHQPRTTETHRMRTPKVKTVNPVTAGDRSMTHRVYQKGHKNQTRS